MPLTVRAVIIIGPDKKIKLIIIYPAATGIVVVISFQITTFHFLRNISEDSNASVGTQASPTEQESKRRLIQRNSNSWGGLPARSGLRFPIGGCLDGELGI